MTPEAQRIATARHLAAAEEIRASIQSDVRYFVEFDAYRLAAIIAKHENEQALILEATAKAHRGCCGVEHDPSNGKLHGYCVVCGIPWPCDTAKTFLIKT